MEAPTLDVPATGCVCPVAGFCARHNVRKPESFFKLCQDRPEFFALWEKGIGPGHPVERLPKLAIGTGHSSRRQTVQPGDLEPCVHRGYPTRIGKCDLCGIRGQDFEVLSCAVHGECSLTRKHSKVKSCLACPDFQSANGTRPKRRGSPFLYEPSTVPEFITTAQLMCDVQKLVSMLPPNTSRIVGLSRSGLCVATMVSMLMHRPLSIVREQQRDIIDSGHGYRFTGSTQDSGPVVWVDDNIMTGGSFGRNLGTVRAAFPKFLTATVYLNPRANLHWPDLYVRELSWPSLLEWNLFNSVLTPVMAVDFDGILCHDCPPGDDDDGERYAHFLEQARPLYYVRRDPIRLIVTARLEKYRAQTRDWLARHGMAVKELIMWPGTDHLARNRSDIGAWKGEHFRAFMGKRHPIQPPIFVESDVHQARRIAEVSGGLCVCPAAGKVFSGNRS